MHRDRQGRFFKHFGLLRWVASSGNADGTMVLGWPPFGRSVRLVLVDLREKDKGTLNFCHR